MNFRPIRSIHLAVPLAIYSFLQAADGGVVGGAGRLARCAATEKALGAQPA